MTTQYIFGDYVLTAAPNAFNSKTSWWISKRHYSYACYAFSTEGSAAEQKKEVEYQVQHIDGLIEMFDNFLRSKEV